VNNIHQEYKPLYEIIDVYILFFLMILTKMFGPLQSLLNFFLNDTRLQRLYSTGDRGKDDFATLV